MPDDFDRLTTLLHLAQDLDAENGGECRAELTRLEGMLRAAQALETVTTERELATGLRRLLAALSTRKRRATVPPSTP